MPDRVILKNFFLEPRIATGKKKKVSLSLFLPFETIFKLILYVQIA